MNTGPPLVLGSIKRGGWTSCTRVSMSASLWREPRGVHGSFAPTPPAIDRAYPHAPVPSISSRQRAWRGAPHACTHDGRSPTRNVPTHKDRHVESDPAGGRGARGAARGGHGRCLPPSFVVVVVIIVISSSCSSSKASSGRGGGEDQHGGTPGLVVLRQLRRAGCPQQGAGPVRFLWMDG